MPVTRCRAGVIVVISGPERDAEAEETAATETADARDQRL